jgi:hypothetical protein
MEFLKGLFGKYRYPPLDPSCAAAANIAAQSALIEPFVRKVRVPLELVPAAGALYVFLGAPSGDFGMAWFRDGREANFGSLREEYGLSQGRMRLLAEKLAAAYARSAAARRYALTIAGREVVVTPSEELSAAIRLAMEEAVS